jgi:tetratricopeptide (TPR) repeat protein
MGALVLFALLCGAPSPTGPQSRPAAEAAEAALSHYEAGEYAAARAAIARAYMIEPWPEYLFARAQIERADGDCAAALEFYRLYLDADPPAKGATLAQEGIDACPVSPAPPLPVASVDAPPPTSSAPRRRRDALGIALSAAGGASLVVGAGLFIGADVQRRAAERASTHDRFGERIDRAKRLGVAASAMVSIGAVLAVAGVVQILVVRRRGKSRERVAWREGGLALRPGGLALRW